MSNFVRSHKNLQKASIIIRWVIVVAVFLIVFHYCSAQPIVEHPLILSAPQSIRVVMDNIYPPYVFLDSTGNLQGILIDQWRLWEQRTGVKVEITGMDWGTAQVRMQAGEYDVIDTIFETDARKQIYEFSKPYATLDVPIFFSKNISGIADARSLRGFPVAVKSGDAAIEFLLKEGVDQLVEFNSYESIIQAAHDQKIVVFVVDEPPAKYFLYKMGIQDQFNSSEPLYSGQFHRAVLKGNTAMLNLVESGFNMLTSTELADINRRWLGITPTNSTVWRTLGYIGIGIAGVLLALIIISTSLRRTVVKRTQALRNALDELSASEQKYRHLVANIPGVVFSCIPDEKWTVRYLSEAFTALLGYPTAAFTEDARNSLFSIIFPPECEETTRLLQDQIAHEGVVDLDLKTITADNRQRWMHCRARSTLDATGAPQSIDGVLLDITDRKEAEENLVRYSALLAALNTLTMELSREPDVDSVCRSAVVKGMKELGFERMGIWQVDPNDSRRVRGTFGVDEHGGVRDERSSSLDINRTLLADVKQEEIPRLAFHENYPLDNDRGENVGQGDVAVAPLWDGISTIGYISVDNLLKHQHITPYQREVLVVFAQVVGHLITLKKAEASVRQLNAGLEKRVEQRTAQLEQNNREMRSFSYSISHDLRSPLRTLDGFSQILLTNYSDQLDDVARNYLQRIRAATQHMAELIDALLKLSRISRSEVQLATISLTCLAREISDSIQDRQPERIVEWIIAPDLTCVADEAMMRLLLVNLLGNAWKFTSRHVKARIELGKKIEEGREIFFVRDDGAGFDMAYSSKLFNPFIRMHSSEEFEGTGIGLAIAHTIVSRHRGQIWAESAVEKGTTIYFTLSGS